MNQAWASSYKRWRVLAAVLQTTRRRAAFNQKQSICASRARGAERREYLGSTDSARERHCLFRCGAFQAARIGRPLIQYSGVVSPPGPNSWPLNIPSAYSVPTSSAVPLVLAQQCGALATYRRVSPWVASQMPRCPTVQMLTSDA